MDSETILKEALRLRPAERLYIIELLTKSLNKPDDKIDEIWKEESEKRYTALKNGKVKSYTINEIISRYK